MVATTMDAFKAAHGGVIRSGRHGFGGGVGHPRGGRHRHFRAAPDPRVFSNEQVIANFNRNNFAYFRQMSIVLSATTAVFSFRWWRRSSPCRSISGSRSPRFARSASDVAESPPRSSGRCAARRHADAGAAGCHLLAGVSIGSRDGCPTRRKVCTSSSSNRRRFLLHASLPSRRRRLPRSIRLVTTLPIAQTLRQEVVS